MGIYWDLTKSPGWQALEKTDVEIFCDSAYLFLLDAEPPDVKWLDTSQTPRMVLWATQALVLLETLAPKRYEEISTPVWEKWSSSIVGTPFATTPEEVESSSRYALSLSERAKSVFAQVVKLVVLGENRAHGRVSAVHTLEGIQAAGPAMLDAAKSQELTQESFENSLGFAIRNSAPESIEYAENLIKESTDFSDERTVSAGAVLLAYAQDCDWEFIFPYFLDQPSFGKAVLGRLSSIARDYSRPVITKLNEMQLASLYVWLFQNFPEPDEPDDGGWVGFGMQARWFKNSVLQSLSHGSSQGAVDGIKYIEQQLPDETWIRRLVRDAESSALRESWIAPSPGELAPIFKSRSTRLIRSEGELQRVLMESLERLAAKLQGELPAVEDLWNRNPNKPKDEEALSDYINRFLTDDLGRKGVIALREVQIKKSSKGQKGERTDIHVDSISEPTTDSSRARHTVVIEVKGCWNSGVMKDMDRQLDKRYLAEFKSSHGIYLVGCFCCPAWSEDDGRNKKKDHLTSGEMGSGLAKQAITLTASKNSIEVFMLDAALK